jgi:hypothetical protein
MFLNNLLNVLVHIANKMGLQKKISGVLKDFGLPVSVNQSTHLPIGVTVLKSEWGLPRG